jgi:hypothetical protein
VAEYIVSWRILLTASSPEEAARRALEAQRDPNSVALTFEVTTVGGIHPVQVDLAPYSCGNCDSTVNSEAAHVACGHGYMTGCADCGIAYEGGYSLASDPESGPPCQAYVNELEIGILAGNLTYLSEYTAIRNRWSDVRNFTSQIAYIS